MFAPHRTAAASYRTLDLETQVAQADPHRLIELLYDGCIQAVARARVALARGDISARGQETTRAIRIVDEGLRASLNHEASGAELAGNLSALYDYMARTLLLANSRSDDQRYAEVEKLLDGLRGAWRAIAPGARGSESAGR